MRKLVITTALALGAASAATAQVRPAEANVRGALERIARLDPSLHSVIAVDPTAIDQAQRVDSGNLRGPLAGQPVLIKDNIESAGPLPTTAGSLALSNNVTNRDAPLVARLRSTGAIIVGKTNLSEWANIRSNHSISGWSAIGGRTHNPWALDRNSCGSSSGSGAAVAAGLVRLAIGSETDGSVTCPASINGIVGLKPTVGLVSRTHIVPISHSQDTAGPMTASVLEAAQLLTAIAGSDPADPATRDADKHKRDYAAGLDANSLKGKRIGVMRFASARQLDPAFETALAILREKGAVLVDIKKFDDKLIGKNESFVLKAELKADMAKYLKGSPAPIRVRTLADLIAFDKAHAQQEMSLFGQELFEQARKDQGPRRPCLQEGACSQLPGGGAERHRQAAEGIIASSRSSGRRCARRGRSTQSTAISFGGGGAGGLAAVAGYPHLTVPMGLVKGLPVGLSFMGPKWSESLLLNLGYAYEQARGPFPTPKFYRSIEESPQIAPLPPAAALAKSPIERGTLWIMVPPNISSSGRSC